MALFKTGLTAIRSNDHLILSKAKQSNTFVHGSISQYLLSHQINGVKFLFRNYEKVRRIKFKCVIPNPRYIYVVCQHKQLNQLFLFSFCL